jgi:hypothetical protein
VRPVLGAAAIASSLFAGSCNSNATTSARSLSCRDAITATTVLNGDYESILDVVALPTATTSPRAAQTGRSRLADPTMRLFAKVGMLVRGRQAVELAVPANGGYWIGWGQPGAPTKVVRLRGCADTGWIVFAGGFWVASPRCLELEVRLNHHTRSVKVGIGDPCPGQLPPLAPSER